MRIRTISTGPDDAVRVTTDGGRVRMALLERVICGLVKGSRMEPLTTEIMTPTQAEQLGKALSDAAAKARAGR